MNLSILQTEIPKRSKSCQNCLAAFSQGDCYHSTLEENKRRDFCLSCWKEIKFDFSLCHWKAVIPKRMESSLPPLTRNAQILELLRSALEENPAEAFLLALYLVRKRVLLHRKEFVKDNRIYSLYEVNATEEMLAIEKVSFHAFDLDFLKRSIASKLNETANQAR